ncbi:Uncharacterized protein FWK35_00031694, partial [Aphis craccivora]
RSVVFGRNFGNGELRAAWRGFHVYWKRSPKEGHRTVVWKHPGSSLEVMYKRPQFIYYNFRREVQRLVCGHKRGTFLNRKHLGSSRGRHVLLGYKHY